MPIQNQQISLLYFISLNGTEITEGTRKASISQVMSVSDIETASGDVKRFFKKNKKNISINYSYVPSISDHTVDGRQGRDFIYNLALNSPSVVVAYKDKPDGALISFNAFISNYRETIERREINSQCDYYSIEFQLEEK